MEDFYCKRRRESGSSSLGPDRWRDMPNGEHTCSYCGSMRAEEFITFCKEVISNPDVNLRIEISDKSYKIYVNRPAVKNAGDGPIKFYMMHAPMSATKEGHYDEVFCDLVSAAAVISRTKFDKFMTEWRARL